MKIKENNLQKTINNRFSINKNFLFKLIIFNWKLLNKNITFWIITSLYLVSNIVVNFTLLILNKSNMLNFSFLSYLISFSFSLLFIFYCVTKLFLESKYTNIDLVMISKPYNKINIYLSRFILILMFVFAINSIHFIVVSILTLSFGLNINWVLYNFVSYIFINTFISTFSISLFIVFAILFKKAIFAIVGLLTILLMSIVPIITRSFDSDYKIQYSNDNYNSFAKLITYNSNNGNHNSYLVNKINSWSNINVNDAYESINNDNLWNYFIPGEWFGSLNFSLASRLLKYDNYSNSKHSYSLVKSFYKNNNFSYDSKLNIITIKPEDINPFLLSNNEYEDMLIDNIKEIINNKNNLNLNDQLLANLLLNKLQNNIIWSENNLNFKEYNTLSSLFGFNQKHSQLFYYWNYYSILKNKTPNLLEKIKLEFNDNLVKLFEYLYTSNISYVNIYDQKSFGNVNEYYPISMSIKENELINKQDIDFIINNLIRFNENVVSYLDINNTYQVIPISILEQLSSKIVNYSSWKEYVLENTLTYSLASNLISKLNNLLPNMYQMNISPNFFNPYQYSYYLKSQTSPYLNYSNLLILMIIIINIFINGTSIYKYKNINYKNFNV